MEACLLEAGLPTGGVLIATVNVVMSKVSRVQWTTNARQPLRQFTGLTLKRHFPVLTLRRLHQCLNSVADEAQN